MQRRRVCLCAACQLGVTVTLVPRNTTEKPKLLPDEPEHGWSPYGRFQDRK